MPHFTYWLLTRVGLIEISTDNDSYAYAIFETMNDRGKPLSPVDMLKAYLLAPSRRGAGRATQVNQIWKQQVLRADLLGRQARARARRQLHQGLAAGAVRRDHARAQGGPPTRTGN